MSALFCDSHSWRYREPGLASSCACVPRSATRPPSSTRIWSHATTVLSRCAMRTEVRPRVAEASAAMMLVSVMESRLEVASSNTRMGESFRMDRAMATRCFSPPDSFSPRSPTFR